MLKKRDFLYGATAGRALAITHGAEFSRPLSQADLLVVGASAGVDVSAELARFTRRTRAETHRLEAAVRRERRAADAMTYGTP